MKIKVVCFDIDGTLYPKWVTNWKLVRSFFPSPLLALRYQRFRSYVRSHGEEQTLPENEEGFRIRQATWLCGENHAKRGASQVRSMSERVERQFYSCWRKAFSKLRPYPHVREAFEQLREQGITIAALSDFPVEGKLKSLEVEDLVDFVACSEQSGYLKPHPAPFRMVCFELQVEPSEVLYVGDSCKKDMVGASLVGMRTALIDPSATSEKSRVRRYNMCPQADTIFSDYREFKEHIPEMLR